jgi:hypothetical protein
MKLEKLAGATSEIWQIFVRDSSSTTGGGLTGLVFNTASLTAYYHRDTDTTATAITLVTMTVGTFTSSGFKEVDATNMPGWYQFCPPNAAIASGAKSCAFHLKGATNMAPLPIEVQLVSYNPDDVVRLGLTSLPNAAAEAAGGLYTRGTGAGQIAQDANGNVRVNVDTIKTNPVANGGTYTFPTNSTGASTTNITAGTITTVTNLTNAATAGDFTATMKTSIGTAVAASAVASVTGPVTVTGDLSATMKTSVENSVWDAAIASHLGAGTTGLALNSAGSAGDPWSTAIPGAYGAGTAGFIVGTNLDATVSSRLASANITLSGGIVSADTKKMNGATVQGDGTSGNLWRG